MDPRDSPDDGPREEQEHGIQPWGAPRAVGEGPKVEPGKAPMEPGQEAVEAAGEAAVLRAEMDLLLEIIRDLDGVSTTLGAWAPLWDTLLPIRGRYLAHYERCYWRYVALPAQSPAQPAVAAPPATVVGQTPFGGVMAPPAVVTAPPSGVPMSAAATSAATQPVTPPMGPSVPDTRPPSPPRPRPRWAVEAVRLGAVARSDLAVHGLAYLGVLLTFAGTVGFVLFAYGSVSALLRVAALLALPAFFALSAWFLQGRGAALVAASTEVLAGALAPVGLLSALSSLGGVAEIAGRVVASLALMLLYLLLSQQRPASPLRFLVGPMLWIAVWAAGLGFNAGNFSAGQVALASSAVTLTLAVTAWRPDHRLAAPTRASGAGMAAVGWVLGLLFALGSRGVTIPVAIVGVATVVSVDLIGGWRRGASWAPPRLAVALTETLLAAASVAELVPGWRWPVAGVVAAFVGLALLEWQQMRGADWIAAAAAGALALTGALLAVGVPWPALVAGSGVAAWVHIRRIRPIGVLRSLLALRGGRVGLALAAALFTLLPADGLLRLLPWGQAWILMAAVILVITITVRVLRYRDALYDWWPCTAAAATLAASSVPGRAPALELAWAAALSALGVALAPGWGRLRAWTGAGALGWASFLILEAVGVPLSVRALAGGAAGLAGIAISLTGRDRHVAGHTTLIGHLATLAALVLAAPGWGRVAALAFWTAGWSITVAAHEAGRSPLLTEVGRLAGRRPAFGRLAVGLPQQVLLVSLPVFAVILGQQVGAFAGRRSLIGVTDAAIAIGYALLARVSAGRRPLAPLIAINAVGLAGVGIAVAAPDLWPSIVAVATSIAAVAIMGGELRRPFMSWLAWVMSIVLGLLLAQAAGVPAGSLHLVAIGIGAVMLSGGLLADDIRAGRRRSGDGIRTAWLTRPVALGALALPAGLAFTFPEGPHGYGWWMLAAAALYLLVATQLRAGAVSGVAEALAALGAAAILPGGSLIHPQLLVPIAAILLGIAWLSERLQGSAVAPWRETSGGEVAPGEVVVRRADMWLRWDTPALAIAHLIAFYALVVAAAGAGIPSETYAGFGILSMLTALWRRNWAWALAGAALILVGAGAGGPGWLALALAATAGGCAIAASRAVGLLRVGLQWTSAAAAASAWAELVVWASWAPGQWVTVTTAGAGAAALLFALALRWRRIPKGWTWPLASLAGTGVLTGAITATAIPARPGAIAASAGLLALGIASGVSAAPLGRRWAHTVAPAVSGWAWILIAGWASWSSAEVVTSTSLAAGAAALAVAGLTRTRRRPSALAAAAWGSFAVIAILAVVSGPATTLHPLGPALLAVSAGLVMEAIAAALAARPYRIGLLREVSALLATGAGAAALVDAQVGLDAAVAASILSGLTCMVATLIVWVTRPASTWFRPLAVFAAVSSLTGLGMALALLPDREPLTLTLLVLGVEAAAAGLTLHRVELLYASPPLLCGAWLLFASLALSGSPEWFSVPVGVAILVVVELVRWDLRSRERSLSAPELLAVEYIGMLLVVSTALFQTVADTVAYGLLGVGLGAGVAAWGVESRVRRRVWVGSGAVLAALVLMLGVPVVRLVPAVQGVTLWAALAGIGVGLLALATVLERSRVRVRTTIRRLSELTAGWE
jgi:hypothetical protein